MRAFSKFGDWVLGKKDTTVLLVGLSGAGKTTLLYKGYFVEELNTIPTVAFNVETINHNGHRFTIWDLSGKGICNTLSSDSIDSDTGALRICDYPSQNITPDSVVLFVHDCSFDERQTEASVKLLHECLEQLLGRCGHLRVLLNKQDLLPTESSNTIALHIRGRFKEELRKYAGANHDWEILDLPRICPQRGGKLLHVLDNVVAALGSKTERRLPFPKGDDNQFCDPECFETFSQSVEMSTSSELPASIGDMKQSKTLTMDDNTFWTLLLKADIKHWDHHSYLRAAYKVLLDALNQKRGIWEATEQFQHHIRRLKHSIKNIFFDLDNRYVAKLLSRERKIFTETYFIRTMTMFWMHCLDLAINRYIRKNRLDQSVCIADFEKILLSSSSLMNASLWEIYYSKGLMFSEESKDYWRLPDLKSLPVLATSQTSQKRGVSVGVTEASSDRIIRFAFTVVQKYLTSQDTRRGFIIKHALSSLQSTTQRVRASNPTMEPYSETQVYFWIQVVHAAFASFIKISEKPSISSSQLSYDNFQTLYNIGPTMWREHYSTKLWNSIEARIAFYTPDLKPLPNFIKTKSTGFAHIHFNGDAEQNLPPSCPELPSAESLAFLTSLINDEARTIPHPIPSKITNHAHLLMLLYEHLATFKLKESHGNVSQNKSTIIDQLSGYHTKSTTYITFWYEIVMKAASKMKQDEKLCHNSFDGFLRSNQHLAYENLPFCYYSQELWNSLEAKNTFIAPDRRSLTICETVEETNDAEKEWIVL